MDELESVAGLSRPGFIALGARSRMVEFDLSPLLGVRPGEQLAFGLEEGPQRLEDVSVSFFHGSLTFTRVQGGILVEGEVETQIEVVCVRCLKPFLLDATFELEETIGLPGRRRPGITYTLTPEGWFDIAPLLREQVWVEIPIKPLCRPDCRGLCPVCGQDLNEGTCDCHVEKVDPRMAVLASLLTGERE